jgi:hypothetical protein
MEEDMEAIFWFAFGAVAGMALLPHLQRAAERVRRVLADLGQPGPPKRPGQSRHPSPWS